MATVLTPPSACQVAALAPLARAAAAGAAEGGGGRQSVAAAVAAALRTGAPLLGLQLDVQKTTLDEAGEQEVATRLLAIERALSLQVAGRPVPGEVRLDRNLAAHAELGKGAGVLGLPTAEKRRRQRGRRRGRKQSELSDSVGHSDEEERKTENVLFAQLPPFPSLQGVTGGHGRQHNELENQVQELLEERDGVVRKLRDAEAMSAEAAAQAGHLGRQHAELEGHVQALMEQCDGMAQELMATKAIAWQLKGAAVATAEVGVQTDSQQYEAEPVLQGGSDGTVAETLPEGKFGQVVGVVKSKMAHYQVSAKELDAVVDIALDTVADLLRDAHPGGADRDPRERWADTEDDDSERTTEQEEADAKMQAAAIKLQSAWRRVQACVVAAEFRAAHAKYKKLYEDKLAAIVAKLRDKRRL